jgi:hypothetical protein
MAETWLKCSACRTEIGFQKIHWVCSVSTCNRNRTRLVFCSVACWDSHVAILRHRDAWAVEARAPTKEAWDKELAEAEPEPARAPAKPMTATAAPRPAPAAAPAPVVRRVVGEAAPAAAAPSPTGTALANAEREILIVVSKLKKYIKERAGMNCSDSVAEILSDHVRSLCDDAIRVAAKDERKTVLDRDVIVARHRL